MLYSMTGFGAATVRRERLSVSVELKAVNNRFFKLSLRISEGYAAWESRIESLIRETVERGTVQASVRIRREKHAADCRISTELLQAYFEQLVELGSALGHIGEFPLPRLDRLVALPGVVDAESEPSNESKENDWPTTETAVRNALAALRTMRETEGQAMLDDLASGVTTLRRLVDDVERAAPKVVPAYRLRLRERVDKMLEGLNVSLNDVDLAREVALFADRCDISEETVRFRSHLEQFEAAMNAPLRPPCGRKLDFLTQELLREANTIGSKANDAEITRNVVEMKTAIERIREMVQNVE